MRSRRLMNLDWHYYFGEPAYPELQTSCTDQTYRWSRAANGRGPARRDYDDRAWEIVDLPHDFVALNGVSDTQPHGGEHFDFPLDRGSAWYRRYFTLDEEDRTQRIIPLFLKYVCA